MGKVTYLREGAINLKKSIRIAGHVASGAAARTRLKLTNWTPRFRGAWPDRAGALASRDVGQSSGYNDRNVAKVQLDTMSAVAPEDYPVLFWLDRRLSPGMRVLDVGGHLGTKHRAFSTLMDLSQVSWTVQDLPEIIAEARDRQHAGEIDAAVHFTEDVSQAGDVDLLLCSGLLQYLDVEFSDLLDRLEFRPKTVLLNKVAYRRGPERVTLEQIGPALVPYRMRNQGAFEAELLKLGYRTTDAWSLPRLSHVIPTHPHLGASYSMGYLLESP